MTVRESIEKIQTDDLQSARIGRLDRLMPRLYSAAGSAVNVIRNRVPLGRKLTATLNAAGAFLTRSLLCLGQRHVSVGGHRLVLVGRRGPSPAFGLDMIFGRYETHVANWFKEVVKPGMTVLDLGAHVGFYTLLAAELVGPEGTVYAFEPEPENFTVLSKNVALSNYSNVKLVHKAIMNRGGQIELFVSRQGNDRHSVYKNPRSLLAESRVQVEATSLDEFLEQHGWPRIDIIKMDIEGAEAAAVEGMAHLLAKSERLKLLLEFAPELLQSAGVDPVQLLRRLSELGFALTSIEDDGTRIQLQPLAFERFTERVQGAVNLICDWKSGQIAGERSLASLSYASCQYQADISNHSANDR